MPREVIPAPGYTATARMYVRPANCISAMLGIVGGRLGDINVGLRRGLRRDDTKVTAE